jgi:hypothetical protein
LRTAVLKVMQERPLPTYNRELASHERYVNIRAQPYVVGEIPAVVVRICVDDHVISVPIPVVAIGQVERGDAEVEASKPEAARAAASEVPYVTPAETAFETAVLPWMLEAEAVVIAAIFMADPFAVAVDVRCFGVIFAVAVRMSAMVFVPVNIVIAMMSLGAVVGNVSTSDIVVIAVFTVLVLREGWKGKGQKHC